MSPARNTLTSGELAREGRVNLETVRYYERENLLPQPPRSPSGYRRYPPEAVRRLRFIKRAQELGFSLAEVRELLALRASPGTAAADVCHRAKAKIRDIEERIRTLQAMHQVLSSLVEQCSRQGPSGDCVILRSIDEGVDC